MSSFITAKSREHPSDNLFSEVYPLTQRTKTAGQIAFYTALGSNVVGEVSLLAEGIYRNHLEHEASISQPNQFVSVPPALNVAETVSSDIMFGGLALAGAVAVCVIARGIRESYALEAFRRGWESHQTGQQAETSV